MNTTLLKNLGISPNESPEKRRELLEIHQMSLLSARKIESDSVRIKELDSRLQDIDKEIEITKKEIAGEIVPEDTPKEESDQRDYQAELERIKKRESLRRQAEANSREDEKTSISDDNKHTEASQPAVNTNQSTSVPKNQDSTSKVDTSLQEAKNYYNQGNYSAAFNKFYEFANAGNVEAACYLGKMYQNGQGTVTDNERYLFWMKKAADAGVAEASFRYGLSKIGRRNGGDKEFNEGMKYLQISADAGYPGAIEKYVEIVESGNADPNQITKAIQYCAQLESQQSDAYVRQQYTNRLANLKSKLKSIKGEVSKKKTQTIFRIVGPILLAIGFLYWFGGSHPEEWEQNSLLKFIPNAWKFFVLPIAFAWEKLDSVASIGINGKFGLQLITIAFCLIYVSMPAKTAQKNYYFKSIYSVSKVIIISIVVWHWLMQLINDNEVFDGMIYYILAFVVCNVLGRLVGWIYKKIIKE